jgi:hypothetical protein
VLGIVLVVRRRIPGIVFLIVRRIPGIRLAIPHQVCGRIPQIRCPIPVVDNAVAPVVDNTVAPVVDNAVVHVDNAVSPVVDNTVAPIVDNAVAPVVDNVVASTADDVGEGAIDDLTEGAIDDVAEGTADDVAEGTTDDVVQEVSEDVIDLNKDVSNFDLPDLALSSDEFSIRASVPGDPKAFIRAELPEPGVVGVTDIFRGGLPKGSGGQFLADTLKAQGISPSKQLVFKGIINEPTVKAFELGIDPANSVLGRTGRNALKRMGLSPKSLSFKLAEDENSI